MVTFGHTETTRATPAQLWRHYADTSNWPDWDQEIEGVTLHGPFAVGTTGVLKLVGGPKTKFTFLEVIHEKSFINVSTLPLATIRLAHHIETTEAGTEFTHTVTITGPLSGLFSRVIGRKVAASLPQTMRTLARLAEGALRSR